MSPQMSKTWIILKYFMTWRVGRQLDQIWTRGENQNKFEVFHCSAEKPNATIRLTDQSWYPNEENEKESSYCSQNPLGEC